LPNRRLNKIDVKTIYLETKNTNWTTPGVQPCTIFTF